MIICPLHQEECIKFIVPRPKTVLIMAPSEAKQSDRCREIIKTASKILWTKKFSSVQGATLIRYGDYFCSICQAIQSCAFGLAIVEEGIPEKTLGNIYFETGLMQGFGKPVILLLDKRSGLPSDFIRNYSIFFGKKEYSTKFRELVETIMELADYYSSDLADYALKAQDYEKAARYYRESYLIGKKIRTKHQISELISVMKKEKSIPYGYKKRLLEDTEKFYRRIN